MAGALVCIEMDSNAKLGCEIVPGDPHLQSGNGKLLETVIKENCLIVVNGSNLCTGNITRRRETVHGTEESVIDHFIVCPAMHKMIVGLHIDEERKYSLTKYTSKSGSKTCSKESDHNTLYLEVNQAWNTDTSQKDARKEILNYKNEENFHKFVESTNNCEDLKRFFENPDDDLETASKKWLRCLKQILKSCFTKIRIKKGKLNPELELLFQEKEKLKTEIARLENETKYEEIDALKDTLDDVHEKIAKICAAKNKAIVEDFLDKTNDTTEGFNQAKVWSMKKRLSPKNSIDPPCAKKDITGQLVTNKDELEKLYVATYEERLQPNKVTDDMNELKSLKEYLFYMKYNIAGNKPTVDWETDDLEKALKTFKNNKARDEHGHIYELFKHGGKHLKQSLLMFLNRVKTSQTYPSILQCSNITSIWKKKGCKSEMNNERGIFNVTKIRSILDKMIYNDFYNIIESNMSCSNIGGRKNRNIRDHLFVVNGIINDVINNKQSKEVDLKIYDVAKCFDKLEYHNTANDLFNAGVNNDKFVTIANSNMKCDVAIKTPWGVTERTSFEKIEMQGTVLAGLKCSISIDTLGKEYLQNAHGPNYLYKNCVPVPPLSFVDDIVGVSLCDDSSVKMNGIIQGKMETKKLELGHPKCFQMHVGKHRNNCHTLSVHGKEMLTTQSEKYLGDILTSTGNIDENITARYNKGLGIVNQVLSTLKEVSFGYHYFEMGLLFRNSMLINGILCSIEALYGLKSHHIEMLEKCDRYFLRQLFNSGQCTPTESFFLETAALPLRFIIIGRRLMFYWNILQKNEKELVRKVFDTQQLNPVKNNICLQFEEDLKTCDIQLSSTQITSLKKMKFKRLVNSKIREVAKDYLLRLKSTHTKLSGLNNSYTKQEYLSSDQLNVEQKQVLYKFRTRMVPVKSNFKSQFGPNLTCQLCTEEDTQSHLLSCNELVKDIDTSEVLYEHIFGSTTQQERAAIVLTKIMKIRNTKLKLLSL